MTAPGLALGTIDYLAREQAHDASAVDIRADIYGLGGVLFWCLTGRTPFPSQGNAVQDLLRRLKQPPPSVRMFRSDIPAALDAVVMRMMAVEPGERYPNPQAVMQALTPFRQAESSPAPKSMTTPVNISAPVSSPSDARELRAPAPRLHRILIVDDEPNIRQLTRHALQTEGIQCDEAANGALAFEAIHAQRYDLVLSDIDMPEMTGPEMLRRLREAPPYPHLKVILVSGRATPNEMAQLLAAGADDFLTKPMSLMQLRARIKAALRNKDAQNNADVMSQNLMLINQQLERRVAESSHH
jgi:CheY-like chemotaxis protein